MFTQKLGLLPKQLSDFSPFVLQGKLQRNDLPESLISKLIKSGEKYLGHVYPTIPITAYMDFCRTGNRVRFETVYMSRRKAINALVLAEFAEAKGRFLDDIINGIYAICEESGWQLPAHNSYIRDTPQLILPDAQEPVMDLFACETGALLAMVRYILLDELNAISPAICKRIVCEIEKRIVTPYLTRHFWWMGNGDEPMCNWTAWCTQNVLLAVFTTGQLQDVKKQVIKQATYSLDCFLKDYGEDGCCEEGAQYFRHAGLCLFNAMEVLNSVTSGSFVSLYEEEKVRNIASYILSMHVDDRYYINFADCSPVAGRAGVREYLFGKRVKDQNVMAFAAEEWTKNEDQELSDEINLFYRLQAAFTAKEIEQYKPSVPYVHPEIYYESAGIFIARDEHYCLAVKAGDNNDSHNHNDTGSFTVYKDGRPFIIDVGVESYTKKTFSEHRYEIWTMQSAYHNLPTFQGIMQIYGEQYAAKNVRVNFAEKQSGISMDIAGAYPEEAGVQSYLRTAVLYKGEHITVEDAFIGSGEEAVLSLMVSEEPSVYGRTIQVGNLGSIAVSNGEITVETIPVTDPRLLLAWPSVLWRVLVHFTKSVKLDIL